MSQYESPIIWNWPINESIDCPDASDEQNCGEYADESQTRDPTIGNARSFLNTQNSIVPTR